jgi:hypothetical protein
MLLFGKLESPGVVTLTTRILVDVVDHLNGRRFLVATGVEHHSSFFRPFCFWPRHCGSVTYQMLGGEQCEAEAALPAFQLYIAQVHAHMHLCNESWKAMTTAIQS